MSFIKPNKQLEMAQSHKTEDKAGQNKQATVAAQLSRHNSDRHD